MSDETIHSFRVAFRDVGMRGEMHSSSYVSYAEEALAEFWATHAPDMPTPAFGVSRVGCQLHKALHVGETVKTAVRVSKIGGKTAGFSILMERDNELVAEAEIVWTACNPETGEPIPLPEDLRDWLYQYLD
ncbi:thioesterase family protein [Rhizobium sp. CSW-27]|uniref:acyl-CoA thioesterase n=1 Tax=Rhizobium sp. CSW-27 TaxID=2839985 RepID=UPI00338DFAD4